MLLSQCLIHLVAVVVKVVVVVFVFVVVVVVVVVIVVVFDAARPSKFVADSNKKVSLP